MGGGEGDELRVRGEVDVAAQVEVQLGATTRTRCTNGEVVVPIKRIRPL